MGKMVTTAITALGGELWEPKAGKIRRYGPGKACVGERKEGGENSRQRQRPVRTPRGKKGMVSSKTSGQLPKVHLRNVGSLEAAVVLRL